MSKKDKGEIVYVDSHGGQHSTLKEALEAETGYDDRIREVPVADTEEDKD